MLSRDGLLEGECDVLRGARQGENVVCARFEDSTDEPVRLPGHENDHGKIPVLLDRSFDHEEDAVGVARAGDHEEIGRGLLERCPTLFQAVHDPDHLDVDPLAGEGRRQEGVVDSLVDGYERSDGRVHGRPPSAW